VLAFFSAWIPIVNFVLPFTIVIGALRQLSRDTGWMRFVAMLWWLVMAADVVGPYVVGNATVAPGGDAVSHLLGVDALFTVPAAVLGVAVILCVEVAQRHALDRQSSLAAVPTPA
jgi:hypothetical protein